jgi:hypothetical protein
MWKPFLCTSMLFFLALSPFATSGAEIIKRCGTIAATGDGCVFDLRATANVLLRVDTRSILNDGQRWRATLVEVGINEPAPSNVGTGSTTNFTGLVQRQLESGKRYELVVTYERPLTGAAAVFPATVRVRFRFPDEGQVTVSEARSNGLVRGLYSGVTSQGTTCRTSFNRSGDCYVRFNIAVSLKQLIRSPLVDNVLDPPKLSDGYSYLIVWRCGDEGNYMAIDVSGGPVLLTNGHWEDHIVGTPFSSAVDIVADCEGNTCSGTLSVVEPDGCATGTLTWTATATDD